MRHLAFVRALALVSVLGCDKESIEDDPPKKKPKPKPTATATATTSATSEATADPPPPCPKAMPKDDEECAHPTTASCWYPSHMMCKCSEKHTWRCDERLPVKGPLSPPELAQATLA